MSKAKLLLAGLAVAPIAYAIGITLFILPGLVSGQAVDEHLMMAVFLVIVTFMVLPECLLCLPAFVAYRAVLARLAGRFGPGIPAPVSGGNES